MHIRLMIAGMLVLSLTGCSPGHGEARVETIGDVTPKMISTVRGDMRQLVDSTKGLKTPDFIAARATDEYRAQLVGSASGASVPCPGVDFQNFISKDLNPVNAINPMLMPAGGLPAIRAPKGTSTFPTDVIEYNRRGLIDRWKVDESHEVDSIRIANTGDVTATTSVWVYGGEHGAIPRLTQVLDYSIVYRGSDMRIISFSVPCWYYVAIEGGEVDPAKYVSGFQRETPEQPLSRQVGGYTVADESGFAYLVAARYSTPQSIALAPDVSIRERASTISQVAIPVGIHNWRGLEMHPSLSPSIYTTNLVAVPGGIWGVIPPFINYATGESMILEGYSRNSPLTITSTIPISPDVIKKWWETTQDSTWVSESWLTIYVLGTITNDRCPPGCLVIRPERIVATAYQRIEYWDTGIINANGEHPVIALRNPETIVADYDPKIAENLAKFHASQHHPKPVSQIQWFPR